MPRVDHLALDLSGALGTELLNPYLGGGAGTGTLKVEASVAGAPSDLAGRIHLDGGSAGVRFARPYATRFEDFAAEIAIDGEGLLIESAGARLNEGHVTASGSWTWAGDLDLAARFDDVIYRLDYGLSTVLSGDLALDIPAEGRGLLSGRMALERGSLRRNIDLERELRRQFLAPPSLSGTQADDFSRIDVDLAVSTLEGVRVRNNVGNLRARWAPLEVRGTMAEPLLEGRIEVDPGGLFFAFGQVARLESGSLIFSGEPGVAPRLDLNATTSLEDPSIARGLDPGTALWVTDPMDAGSGETEARTTALETGLAGYLGSQLTSLARTEISTRPLLLFGEADPATRLTLSVDLSTHVALATSVNLREAESQTYVLDLHQLGPRRDIRTQVFTNDADREGATVQQVLEFIGSRPDANRPLLRKIRFEPPPGVSRRGIHRSLALRSGEPLPESIVFEAEVDVEDYLHFKGYPDARVQASLTSPGEGSKKRDLVLDIEAGPLVSFEFTGVQPDEAFRSSITSLYRIDFYEEASIEEMKEQTARVASRLGVSRSPGRHPHSGRYVDLRSSRRDPRRGRSESSAGKTLVSKVCRLRTPNDSPIVSIFPCDGPSSPPATPTPSASSSTRSWHWGTATPASTTPFSVRTAS